MKYVKKYVSLVVTVILLAACPMSYAQSDEEKIVVPAKAQQVCAACHGLDGNQSMTPDTPKIGGQPADYLAQALEQYKNGMRNHPIMGAMAAGLTKDDIQQLSAYFSTQASQLFSKY